mgnify:FL=1
MQNQPLTSQSQESSIIMEGQDDDSEREHKSINAQSILKRRRHDESPKNALNPLK